MSECRECRMNRRVNSDGVCARCEGIPNADTSTRFAVVGRNNATPTPETITAYMPSNYKVTRVTKDKIVISGTDNAGWTLDDYVIPRLGSGLIFAKEITAGEAGSI